jgi:hypothetical protein
MTEDDVRRVLPRVNPEVYTLTVTGSIRPGPLRPDGACIHSP